MYVAEILLTKQVYEPTDWLSLVRILSKHVGGIQPITLIVEFRENHVQFYAESKKDISGLSGGIEGFMLHSVHESDIHHIPPDAKNHGYSRYRLVAIY